MATQNQQKPELIAIYRLEFYKKQKKWKFSADARKEKELRASYSAIKNSNVLNETYSIETKADDETNVLNDAFLKDESDKDSPDIRGSHTTLHTQWLEPINACQECQHANVKAENPWADYVDDGWMKTMDVDKCSGDANEFDGFDGRVEEMVWTNSSVPQPPWTGDIPAPLCALDGERPPQPARAADMLAWPDDQLPHIWGPGEWTLQSLESVEEFLMGAHCAPHSSEVDLRAPEGDGGEQDASRMSPAALSGAVRRHTGALRALLREAGQRRKCRSSLSLDVCAPDHFGLAPRDFFSGQCSYDAFPTRDVPSTPLSPTNHFAHVHIPLPSMSQFKNDFHPLPLPNQYKEALTPTSPTRFNEFTPLPPKNQFNDDFTPLQSVNQFRNAYECNQFTPVSPANLYRDGFLAGSHRNKVPLSVAGRGRGRLGA